jgi:hypothetical protein
MVVIFVLASTVTLCRVSLRVQQVVAAAAAVVVVVVVMVVFAVAVVAKEA